MINLYTKCAVCIECEVSMTRKVMRNVEIGVVRGPPWSSAT